MAYIALVLSEKSRAELLAKFPPKFPDVICHHVTLSRDGSFDENEKCEKTFEVVVSGYSCDDSLEAIAVTVDGHRYRSDGNAYHITLSLDRSKGRKPVDSNKLISDKGWKYAEKISVDAVLTNCQ